MKGDFSRWTFDAAKQYSRVLSLQGRVFLDADVNEAQEIQLRTLRRLAADLLGPHAGPGTGFEIGPTSPASKDFVIASGRYYVDGILCENPAPLPADGATAPAVRYSTQPYLPNAPALPVNGDGVLIAYLDVWERYLTDIEDEDRDAQQRQGIREVALGGPDTAGRSAIVWQIRVLRFRGDDPGSLTNDDASLERFDAELARIGLVRTIAGGTHPYGRLAARARRPAQDDSPCAISPESRYRGPENQLYRVEIHEGGTFPAPAGASAPTFKWSRENGSVVFPIQSMAGATVVVDRLGRDDRLTLAPGDWVEVVDDEYVLNTRAEPLLRVVSVDPETRTVQLSSAPAALVGDVQSRHPLLRRWDGAGTVALNPDPASGGYLALEDGVEVRFSNGDYRTSDYWIIPARTATGDVEWPGPVDNPRPMVPHGVVHAYAPLAVIDVPEAGSASVTTSLRRQITQLWS